MTTKRRPARAAEGAKALITAVALAVTIGGWAALAARPEAEVAQAPAGAPALSAPAPALRRPARARPAPVTITRSSR